MVCGYFLSVRLATVDGPVVKRIYVRCMTDENMKRVERIDRVELMRTFVRIVETGSLSAAARQLSTTQATVSRRLQSLETLLGARLLLRTTHATKLTDDGERCYQHARRVIDSWLALEDEVGQAEDEPVGVLRVRAPHAFGQDQLLKPLTEFLQRYPQLSVEWMLNDKSVDFLSDNLDCAIRVGAEVDPATVSVMLAEVPRCVVASPALLAQFPPVNTPEDLLVLPWIAISTFYQRHVDLFDGLSMQPRRIAITPRLSTDSLHVARNTVLTGLGVAVVSSWTVKEDIREGRLIHLLPEWQPAALPVHLVYPWSRYYPARLRRFLEMMKQVMPDIAGMRKPVSEQ
ncbi:LysR family transcriptional regulator [Enterobacter sp. LM3]